MTCYRHNINALKLGILKIAGGRYLSQSYEEKQTVDHKTPHHTIDHFGHRWGN